MLLWHFSDSGTSIQLQFTVYLLLLTFYNHKWKFFSQTQALRLTTSEVSKYHSYTSEKDFTGKYLVKLSNPVFYFATKFDYNQTFEQTLNTNNPHLLSDSVFLFQYSI